VPVSQTQPRAIDTKPSGPRPSPADRLLDTATTLFAANGIRAVGIDRILGDAGVARASLYSSFGSKEGLVIAYLERLDRRDRARWESAVASLDDPVAKVLAFFDLAIASAPVRNFRGCQYVNAATEFPDQELAPVRDHRAWVLRTLTQLLTAASIDDPEMLARHIQLLYDGALAGSKVERSENPIRLGRDLAAAAVLRQGRDAGLLT
jgi:AcrR family transcriptional regulator